METGHTLGTFLFEEVLCHWGAVEEIVTDNGTAFVTALGWLERHFGIWHIRILAYNSQANGIVERQHCMIQESIVKACEDNAAKWPAVAPYAFWVDHATTCKSMGHSPFYMAHSVEPVLPFDITLATFLVLNLTDKLSTVDLIATQTRQLLKCDDDLAAIHSNILKSCFESVCQFERTICDHNFSPGAFVLMENDLGCKVKLHYTGLMVVLHHMQNGLYCLAELDSSVSNLCFTAFCLVPYHSRLHSLMPVTCLVDRENLACTNMDEDIMQADSDADNI
jgi:hypothetical protein